MKRILKFTFLVLIIGLFRVLGAILGLLGLFTRGSQPKLLHETLRLYRKGPDGTGFAWFYEIDGRLYIDRGRLGEMADRRNMPLDEWPAVEAEIAEARNAGFRELNEDKWQMIQVVYAVAGDFASPEELDKRNAVTELLDTHFALTGQGYWFDSSTGLGTMECAFEVVDFEIAKEGVLRELRDAGHGDHIDIRDRFSPLPEGSMRVDVPLA